MTLADDAASWGPCSCASLEDKAEGDDRCPRPGTVMTVGGWVVCQLHAELIDEASKAMTGNTSC